MKVASASTCLAVRPGPIVVIGSINMDLVCRVHSLPQPGQTVLGGDLAMIPGGKGANQAVAAARLGGQVHFVGRVGEDDFGHQLIDGLRAHGVDTRHLKVTRQTASGCALILVDDRGENSIVVAPGANHRVSPEDVDEAAGLIAQAGIVLMQLEIPLRTVEYAVRLCRRLGTATLLDPAPAPAGRLPRALWAVDILSPNQTEARGILGIRKAAGRATAPLATAKHLGYRLLQRGPRAVVLKLGRHGAMIHDHAGKVLHVRGFRVKVADTTAAGDAFTAALGVALCEGQDLPQSVRFANAAGARCCEGFGAQPSLPTREAVRQLLAGGY